MRPAKSTAYIASVLLMGCAMHSPAGRPGFSDPPPVNDPGADQIIIPPGYAGVMVVLFSSGLTSDVSYARSPKLYSLPENGFLRLPSDTARIAGIVELWERSYGSWISLPTFASCTLPRKRQRSACWLPFVLPQSASRYPVYFAGVVGDTSLTSSQLSEAVKVVENRLFSAPFPLPEPSD